MDLEDDRSGDNNKHNSAYCLQSDWLGAAVARDNMCDPINNNNNNALSLL